MNDVSNTSRQRAVRVIATCVKLLFIFSPSPFIARNETALKVGHIFLEIPAVSLA
jgi:hypothetical protein